ncbi:hypothetical protein [Halalkalibacter krulwichiae]|uniref:DUF3052 domain-containing protein n=1 Tax=Halalkalibacter krulwichiae TaxID=199441 RepID=A0A1X9M8N3_9BACI|nr:hypothetical protein [Halalkalibacter krulwichiae]ARK28970.1 hypothetical protein BkAM31D_03340 [Halalkalibacter krulwichiae]
MHPVIKKLQWKTLYTPILVIGAPKEFEEVMNQFGVEVHTEARTEKYGFILVFGISNKELQEKALAVVNLLNEDGLLWLCYPKKSSKTYKGSDCSRDTVGAMLAERDFEPVRQIAIDEDWSALRYRHISQIKSMKRTFAVTAEGKERTMKEEN